MRSRIIRFFKIFLDRDSFEIFLLVTGLLVLIAFVSVKADVIITLPANCGSICAETAADGSSPSWTNVNDIILTEQDAGDFPKNKTNATIIVSAPAGWSFNAGVGSITHNSADINSVSLSVASSSFTITWTTPNGGGDNEIDVLTLSGLQIRPDNTTSIGGNATCTSISDAVAGIITSTIFINIGIFDAPSILSNPTNSTISEGQNTSFSISASNSPTFYQWEYSDDSGSSWNVISDGGVYSNSTTSTLNITVATSTMDTYLYRAVAINGCGSSSYSANAMLNVTDICSSAISISGCGVANSVTATTGTSGVWDPVSNSCGYATPGGEIIYSYVPSVSGTSSIEITTVDGSYIDYFFQESSCSSSGWTCIGDYSSTGTYGSLSMNAGTTYYFLLDDENTTSSSHTFYITCPVAAPANEDCSNAVALPCGTTDLAGTTQGTSVQTHGTGCSIADYGVWYTFTGDGAETTISSTADFDHEMAIAYGTCGSLTNVACVDGSGVGTESYTFTPTSGVDYYIYISYYSSGSTTTGEFTISRSACPSNMAFNSCTTTQANTDDITIGSVNQEIIGIEVVTDGALNPISITRFNIRTDGSDDYSTDISSLNIWYTGTNSTFSTSDLFGTTQTALAPGNDIGFIGSQQLLPGTNYFWLTYDIPAGATAGNYVDAQLQFISVDGSNETPSSSNPGSGRQLLDGCYYTLLLEDSGFDGWQGGTISVQVNGSNVLTNETCVGGSTSFTFVAETGSSITTTYTAGTSSTENSYLITNPNDAYILSSGEASTTPISSSTTADCDAVKEFTTNGDTYHFDDAGFIITEDRTSQSGSVWSNYKIDLSQDFTIKFDIYLGDSDGGADGSAFVLQGSCTSAGGSGSALGYGGIGNSIAVEFDTYDNGSNGDPSNDHIAIMSNGNPSHFSLDNLAGPYDSGGNIADDLWHSVIIDWTVATDYFSVSWDGSEILNYTGDIVTDIFSGSSQVFWGFSGATGALTNLQKVNVTEYPVNTTELTDESIDVGESVSVEAATGVSSYTWLPDDGSISDPTIYNPVLTPDQTTEYTCLIEDGCGNIITNKFTVFVDLLLPVEMIEYNITCNDGEVVINWETSYEINNFGYEVQRSENLKDWETLDFINSKGPGANNYSYVTRGINKKYYRIVQTDINGDRKILDNLYAECNLKDNFLIYPNPCKEIFYVELDSEQIDSFVIELYNNSCILVKKDMYSKCELNNNRHKVDMYGLKPGIYNIRIIYGDTCLSRRVVKQ